MCVIAASNYIRVDNNLEIEEIVLDEATILKEILPYDESDVEIEKISYSVALVHYTLLIQYVEQQEPVKFVKDQDLPQLRNKRKRMLMRISKAINHASQGLSHILFVFKDRFSEEEKEGFQKLAALKITESYITIGIP
ncbi:15118_t:CDS:2 [Gigaspora margarita]|uniref:15118_t:CDS:1 n=1 Tax=Gigaspora margarita TaxID=4874 RepID=A0ABN7UFF4_GIGMA|nr:15118_t:CDS:2 [Gigaspora margarita]